MVQHGWLGRLASHQKPQCRQVPRAGFLESYCPGGIMVRFLMASAILCSYTPQA